MATVKDDPNSPWPHYFSIGAGAITAAMALTRDELGTVGLVKLLIGGGLILYGTWKLVEARKRP